MGIRRRSRLEEPPAAASGAYPWIACGLGALFFCYGYFQRVAPSVMIAELMRDFAVNAAILGNLAALYFYAYAALQLPAGLMLDRWGPRRVLSAAIVLCGAGSLLFATAGELASAYAGRLLIGAGAGFAWVGTLKLASIWFPPRRFALVGGLSTMLGMVGAVGGQAPLAAVVQAAGWRETLVGTAVFAGLLAGAVWLVVRDGPAPESTPPAAAQAGMLSGLAGVLATPQTWVLALFGALLVPNLAAFAGLWGVPYMMRAYGLERPAAAAATSMVLVGMGGGAVLLGWWSDRIRRRKVPMLAGAVAALSAISALVYAPGLPLWAAYGLCLVYGTGTGAFVLCYATGREHNRAGATGTAMAVLNMTMMTVGAVFQPLIGWLLDLNWDGRMEAGAPVYSAAAYRWAFGVFVASGALACLAGLRIRETHCRPVER